MPDHAHDQLDTAVCAKIRLVNLKNGKLKVDADGMIHFVDYDS